ncbi:MAG TPA: glycoside hydrolase family 3 N-terminal domain-containing protein [Ilumatobacteraceae bacterium]|nr:glycoside hydrolase family 3 N-terminal domain-containing protein [Ilumatobacteraceae bacterium]
MIRLWHRRGVHDAFSAAADRVSAGADHHAEAAQLVGEMTLEEKLGCLDGDTPLWPGLFDMTSGGYYEHPWPAAEVARLGIPGIAFADGPRGCVVGDATAFPVSMARGATFDPDLEERIGEAIGSELRASGATFTGAVCMNLLRHPAWGRAQETYGEDPHHVGEMAAAFTRGLQRHVMACMKHFALNSMENARFRVDVHVDERALHEVYLPHFRRVAAEGVASVMSAYNSVNGEWCGENATLLTGILRDEWGWDGFVVSDFIFGLRDAVKSVRAGLDIEMPFRQQRAVRLLDAIESGELDVASVDAAVGRIVGTLLRFADVFDTQPPLDVVGTDEHRSLAREAAVASTVLLANDGVLPVDPSAVVRVAVLGRLAAVRNLGDGGSSDVRASNVVTPLAGIRDVFDEVVHDDTDVSIVEGADLVVVVVGYTKDDEGEYIDDAGTGALAVELFAPIDHPTLGRDAPYTPPAPTGRPRPTATPDGSHESAAMAPGGDRSSLRLSDADEALISAVASLHDRVVVVVQAGSAVLMPWADSVAATLVTWYSGVEGGTALAEVLTGAAEPRGRLPFAVPHDPAHLVEFDRDASEAEYGLFHGQWKLDREGVTAHFPFGWGLGYGTVRLAGAELVGTERVRLSVANDGGVPTSTVLFVFAGHESSRHDRPPRRLVGFARVDVVAGATEDVEVDLDWSMLDLRIGDGWVIEPGRYVVEAGRYAGDPSASRLHLDRR